MHHEQPPPLPIDPTNRCMGTPRPLPMDPTNNIHRHYSPPQRKILMLLNDWIVCPVLSSLFFFTFCYVIYVDS